MSKLLIWVTGGKIEEDYTPSNRFKVRLDKAIEVYNSNVNAFNEIEILVSGRWANSTDEFLKTEARVGKEYILKSLPNAFIFEENISVDIIGNYAFSKQLIINQNPDKVIGIIPKFLEDRSEYLKIKVFNNEIANLELFYTVDELTLDSTNYEKQRKAMKLCESLLDGFKNGDDSGIRNALLYPTPYYFRVSQKQNEEYFDKHWPGGFDDFIAARKHQIKKDSML